MPYNKEIQKMCENIKDVYKIEPSLYQLYNVKRGLRNQNGSGVLVGLTEIGDVHGYIMDEGEKIPVDGELRYRGINVADIVHSCQKEKRFGYEENAYLLLFGHLPNKDELKDFSELLGSYRNLPENFTEDMILKAPSRDIMNKLARGVLSLYSYDDNPDEVSIENLIEQSLKLIARFPTLMAHAYATKIHYFDDKSLILHNPQKELSTAQNILYMIRPDNAYTEEEARLLDLALILHAEHGGGNNSTFTTHVVSSSGTDTYSAISAALGSLKGPLHGGANLRVMGMIDDFKENVKDITNEEEIKAHIIKLLKKESYDKSGLIYGMGHAVYTKSDPRAVLLYEYAKDLAKKKGLENELFLYDTISKYTPALLKEVRGTDKDICPNVDFYSGFVYNMLGISRDLFTPLFSVARIVGWCAHRIEEVYAAARIIRPAYKSITKKEKYAPINER